ncbi:MAG: hypothetical protein IKE03_00340 [Blautia sp.]|nr:hypothetical protein [Blautia sp.]
MRNKGLAGRCAAVILSAAMWMSGAGAAGVMAGEADYDIFVSGETMKTETFDQGSALTEEFSETDEQEIQAEEDFLPDVQEADPEETPAEVSQKAMAENPEEEGSEAAAVVSAPETVDPVAEFSGSESVGDALFTGGDEAADFVGEESATATPAAGAVEVKAGDYVLMNIPYAKFYEAEIGQANAVDAVSSSTLNKPRTGGLVGGSYHVDPAGTDISGVIYPVMVEDPAALDGYTQVTDESSVTITVTNRGQEATTTYTGSEALFESPDYSYYVLSESPVRYKVMHADGSFDAVNGEVKTVEGVTGEVTVGAHHADVEIALTGTTGIETGARVSGIVLTTEDGGKYALRHIANIWRGTEIGWNLSDMDLGGKTITNIRYYTLTDVIDYPVSLSISKAAYVLMNIPYAKFYEAEIGQADAVDAVSSSTLNKPRTGGLAGGSYHVDPTGTDISSVIYPVMVKDVAMLANYKQVTDEDSVTITVTNRGQEATTTYTGSEALFESPDYSYYLLAEKPARFKVLNEDGTFSAVGGRAATVEGVTGTVKVGARHADIEIALTGTEGIAQGDQVSGIIVTTNDGVIYPLRHIAKSGARRRSAGMKVILRFRERP